MASFRGTPALLVLPLLLGAGAPGGPAASRAAPQEGLIPLPAVVTEGRMAVERALATRRSHRSLAPDPLTLAQLAQLLWAAQGVTRVDPGTGRELKTAPSAGATYPLEVYAVVGAVEGLEAGLYRYVPRAHALAPVARGDLREALRGAALGQAALGRAPVTLVVAGVVARTATRYGERAERYVHIEVGAAAQNVYLQATALGLGTVYIGAYRDAAVKEVLATPADQEVYALLPVGHVAEGAGGP